METRFLLDTNICIYIRQKRPIQLVQRFEKLQAGEAAISVVTYGELLYGAEKSAHRSAALERIRALIHLVPALPMPENAGQAYGKVRFDLESRGEVIGNNDLWIAAHALASELTLVTNNDKEFRRVRGLKVQNWVV
jgi:tRNA(fMet)-specific endonuclease VapC